VKVNFFGKLADSIARQVDFDLLQPCTAAELRVKLDRAFPGRGLADPRVRTSVGGVIVRDDATVAGEQPVDMLSPVSGG